MSVIAVAIMSIEHVIKLRNVKNDDVMYKNNNGSVNNGVTTTMQYT